MLTQTVKYTDYNGQDVEETLYFNLTQSELLELQEEMGGDLVAELSASLKDRSSAIRMFKMLVLKSYGIKSEDGRRFIKKRSGVPVSEEFEDSLAYDEFIMTLLRGGAVGAANFVNGVMPAALTTGDNAVALMKQTSDLVNAGKVDEALKIIESVERKEELRDHARRLAHEEPVTDENVPRIAPPPEEKGQDPEDMSKEELLELLRKQG